MSPGYLEGISAEDLREVFLPGHDRPPNVIYYVKMKYKYSSYLYTA